MSSCQTNFSFNRQSKKTLLILKILQEFASSTLPTFITQIWSFWITKYLSALWHKVCELTLELVNPDPTDTLEICWCPLWIQSPRDTSLYFVLASHLFPPQRPSAYFIYLYFNMCTYIYIIYTHTYEINKNRHIINSDFLFFFSCRKRHSDHWKCSGQHSDTTPSSSLLMWMVCGDVVPPFCSVII